MADQEFLASFGVEIDESGLDRLQKALKENRTLAEQLASAFDSARNAVSEFFKQLSASTLPSGELSPYQRLMEMSEKGMDLSCRSMDWRGVEVRAYPYIMVFVSFHSIGYAAISIKVSPGLNSGL